MKTCAPSPALMIGGALFLPAIAALLYAAAFAPVYPDWDGWALIGHLNYYSTQRQTLSDIAIYKQGEHPWGIASIVFVLAGRIANYQLDLMAILSTLAVIATALTLLILAWRGGVRSAASLFALAAIMCSLLQSENLLLGFQLGFTSSLLCGVLASICSVEYSGATSPWRRVLALAGMTGTLIVGGLSSAISLAAGPSASIPLFYKRDRASLVGLAFIGLLLAAWLFAFFNRNQIPGPAPLALVASFLVLCGLLFGETFSGMLASGLVTFALFSWLAVTGWSRAAPPKKAFIAVGIFALCALAIIAHGRSQFGVHMQPRYNTFAALLTAATLFLAFDWLNQTPSRIRNLGRALLFAAVSWSTFLGGKHALDFSNAMQSRAANIIPVIMNYRTQSLEQFSITHPFEPRYVPPMIEFLDAHSLNVFAHRKFYSQFSEPFPAASRKPVQQWQSEGGAISTKMSDGSTLMRGPIRIFSHTPCPEHRPCTVRIEADVISAPPASTIGVIFRGDGGERLEDSFVSIASISNRRIVHTANGSRRSASFDAYLYSADPDAEIRFRDFSVALQTERVQAPSGCGRIFCLFSRWVGY